MDIKQLKECGLVWDIELSGQNVIFKAPDYTASSMKVGVATISCPLSGNYLLTESAKIVSGKSGEVDETETLEKLFFGLKEAASQKERPEANDASVALDATLRRAAMRYLNATDTNADIESLRFDFLKQCSDNFTYVHERIKS